MLCWICGDTKGGRLNSIEKPIAQFEGENSMKTILIVISIVLITTIGLAGCTAPTTQPPNTHVPQATQVPLKQTPVSQVTPQSKVNTEIVLNMVENLNNGDVEGSLAYFADDAVVYIMGFPPTGMEVYHGREQIRSLWQDSVDNHFKWEAEVTSALGDMVNIRAKTWHDFTRQLDVAPLEYTDVYELKDGKIVTYGSWLTKESLDRFKPAFFAAVPPEPNATPASSPPVSEMTVTIAGGTCTTDNPTALQAGEVAVTLNVEDQDNDKYALTMFNLDSDKDILDLMVSTVGVPPSWADILLYEELGPGQSKTYTFTLKQGPVYMICWSKPPGLPIGNVVPIPVLY
jgi:ketosteroid isomerase-like protein